MKNIVNCMNVITKEEKREEADRLRDEFYKAGNESFEQETDDMEMTPVEELTGLIISQLVYSAYRSFDEMIDGLAIATIKDILCRMNHSSNDLAVRMLQSMFLITGNVSAAEELDIIGICAEFDDSAYDLFIDELFQTDLFDWFLVEKCLEDAYERPCMSARLS